METVRRAAAALALIAVAAPLAAQVAPDDIVLRAMRDEMGRAKQLAIPGVEKPYYIEFALEDALNTSIVCSSGALVSSVENVHKTARVQVRVGDYSFDNTNYIFSDFFGGRHAGTRAPAENAYGPLRHAFWLAADRSYKGALEAIARKRAALRSMTVQEKLDDFSKTETVRVYLPVERTTVDREEWARRLKELSAALAADPRIQSSTVELEAAQATQYFVDSEGTEARTPETIFVVRLRAEAQAGDGMPVRDAVVMQARSLASLPSPAEMRRRSEEVARNVAALAEAPPGEDYAGPVLLEGMAAPQLIAQVLGANLCVPRRPVTEPGRPLPSAPGSELEGRIGSRIMPEWMDVLDDPAQERWRGVELFGYYRIDMEGVVPRPLLVVEKGAVTNYLTTRQPVRGFPRSNGRARLTGMFGTKTAAISNLFVKARQAAPAASLRKQLLEMIAQRAKPYGMILRKLDFPSTMPLEELRKLSASGSERGSGGRLLSPPVLAYRAYPDGREELVRGLRIRGMSVRSLRDILAASDEDEVFSFMNNTAPLAVTAGASYVTASAVIAPSLLFEDMELEKRAEDWPRLPVVPPPPISGH